VKILGKVENLVCRILRSFSTGDENGFDVHNEPGKFWRHNRNPVNSANIYISSGKFALNRSTSMELQFNTFPIL
jgi:hypothetical protein